MSFELYVNWYLNGVGMPVQVSDVRSCFDTLIIEHEPDYWFMIYDERRSCNLSLGLTHEGYCDYLVIFRPYDHPSLLDAVIKLIKLNNGVMFYADCPGPIVVSADVEKHLPVEMIESLGNVVVVESGDDIQRLLDE